MAATSCKASISFAVASLTPLTASDVPTPPPHPRTGKLPDHWVRFRDMLLEIGNATRLSIDRYRSAIPSITVFAATNGFNHSEVIHHLLDSGLQFHGLSAGGKKWGKLATFLTKYRALMDQVRRGAPYQLLMEDDLVIQPSFGAFVERACARMESQTDLDVLQLDSYAEALLTSLDGARRLTRLVREHGIQRNDDQQLLDPKVMGTRVGKLQVRELQKRKESRPWTLARATNHHTGHIFRTRRITWAEMAMLRALTDPAARRLPSFGAPGFTDYLVD